MKNPNYFVIAVIAAAILAGCGAMSKEIARMSQSQRTDVFTEVASEGSVPAGYVDMIIRATIKIPPEGYYPLESKHDQAAYPFLINIDGQAALWRVEGRKHLLPKYVDGKTSHDPEAGEGMKYQLEKKVRLTAGFHKVFFGLPEAAYFTAADISVKSDRLYLLEFRPDYRKKTLPTPIPTFLEGIESYEVILREISVQ